MPELLERAGFHIRSATRADCVHCQGHSRGTVAFTNEVAFCHRCQWKANQVTLACELGLLPRDHRSRTEVEQQVRRRARLAEAVGNFRALECALLSELADVLDRLRRVRAGCAARIQAIESGKPERWRGEQVAPWECLSWLPYNERRTEAAYNIVAFGDAPRRVHFALRPADREGLVKNALYNGIVRACRPAEELEQFLTQFPDLIGEINAAVEMEIEQPSWPTPEEVESICARVYGDTDER